MFYLKKKNNPIEQILNSTYVEVRETFPTFEHCTGKKIAMTSGIKGFHDVSVKFP